MNRSHFSLGLAYFVSLHCTAQTFYKDFFNDQHNTSTGWVTHRGQKLGTDMAQAEGLEAYGEGYGWDIWLMDKSTFKVSMILQDTIPGNNDTTLCVSVQAHGPRADRVSPEPYFRLPGLTNFYYEHCGSGAVNVRSYHREVYWDAWPHISMQLYTSSNGPKLAFVCEPGSDPTEIELALVGQDSLQLDVSGILKMYVQGNWFQLAPAVAYQVDGDGNNIPLNWLPTYEIDNGEGLIRFEFENYDTNKPLIVQIGGLPLAGADVEEPRNMNWCTYAGSNRGDEFMATDVDDNGDAYATGYAYEANFPVNTGFQIYPAASANFAGSEDIVTMKFDHDSKQIIWATYQGGSGQPTSASDEWRGLDKAYDMAVYRGTDSDLAYAFVTGSTMSPDFFTYEEPGSPFDGAAQPTYGGGPGGEQGAFLLAYTQDEGKLHWSTTMGPDDDIWWADGLGVDVFDDGTLFWVGRTSGSFNNDPIPGYPYVSPSGAFTNVNGGGFFALFDSDYHYEWNTLFGTQCSVSGIFDVKLGRKEGNGPRKALITGVTCAGGLDVYNPVGNAGFYQPTHGGGQTDAFFAMLDLDDYQLDYSTYWGGNGDDYGIAVDVEFVSPNGTMRAWVGGMTRSTNLTSAQLPLPTGLPTGVLHQAANGGEADGMLLNWELAGFPGLEYGTLYGGVGHDAILDVEVGKRPGNFTANQIYAVGESRSPTHILLVDNAELFQQPLLGNTAGATQRDGFLLALEHFDYTPIWTSYIGGFNTDKCWGVASTVEELYIVGGTISDQSTFPLKEFDTTIPQDWFDGDIFNNTADGGSGEYSFLNMRFNSMFGGSSAFDPWPNHSFDGFIASFGASPALSVVEDSGRPMFTPQLIDPEGLWRINTTDDSRWLSVHDAKGRIVQSRSLPMHSESQQVDLRGLAHGIYAVTIMSSSGGRTCYKLSRP